MISGILAEGLTEYLDRFAPGRERVFLQMEAYAAKHDVPIVGPHEGALLHVLAKASGARRILELGTAIGYSGSWLAKALPRGGKLTTIEWDEGTARMAAENFRKAGVSDKVKLLVGSAQELVRGLKGGFDLVFNDIDKEGYVEILPHCIALLRKGGLLITDNVLWSGRVAREPGRGDDGETSTIREYNERLAAHPDLLTVIVPLRDGVAISLKV